MNSFKKIAVNEKGVQMRKLVTAIVVATSVFASAVFAEVDETYLTSIYSYGDDSSKQYACDEVIYEVIRDLTGIESVHRDMIFYVKRKANFNTLKDKDLFEQYNRQKQYLETVIKDIDVNRLKVYNKAIEIADKYCVNLTNRDDITQYDDEVKKKVVNISVAKDTLSK